MKNKTLLNVFCIVAAADAAAALVMSVLAYFAEIPKTVSLGTVLVAIAVTVAAAAALISGRRLFRKDFIRLVSLPIFIAAALAVVWGAVNYFLCNGIVTDGGAVNLGGVYHLFVNGEVGAEITRAEYLLRVSAQTKLLCSGAAAVSAVCCFVFRLTARFAAENGDKRSNTDAD